MPGEAARIAAYHFGWRDERAARPPARRARRSAPRSRCWPRRRPRDGRRRPASRRGGRTGAQLLAPARRRHGRRPDPQAPPHRLDGLRTNAAILTGDGLLAAAYEVLAVADSKAVAHGVRILARAVIDLVEGQCADLAFEERDDVTLDECLTMASRKTGALMGAACALGALYGGATTAEGPPAHVRRAFRPGLPAHRRPARHLGRPRRHRQTRPLRPAQPQEVAAGRRRADLLPPGRRRAGRPLSRRRTALDGRHRASRRPHRGHRRPRLGDRPGRHAHGRGPGLPDRRGPGPVRRALALVRLTTRRDR